jgi:hypothetical protein
MANTFSRLKEAYSSPVVDQSEQSPPAITAVRAHRMRGWQGTILVAVAVIVLILWVFLVFERHLETRLPEVKSISILNTFADQTPVQVTITAAWQKVSITVPTYAVRSDVTLWRKMNFDDWDVLDRPLRQEGLTAMWAEFSGLVHAPRMWDHMTAHDWDLVPQPIRAMAYIEMVRYWSGYYQVGTRFGLPRGTVTNTMAAIVMAESWFEHRGSHTNPPGDRDIGLGGSSEYCRRILQRLGDAGFVDFTLAEEEYFNPWQASRVVAVWFELMLEEADGDLELAVRMYHRGRQLARRGEGEAYLGHVKRLRHRYIRNEDSSPAWHFLFTRAFGDPHGSQTSIPVARDLGPLTPGGDLALETSTAWSDP